MSDTMKDTLARIARRERIEAVLRIVAVIGVSSAVGFLLGLWYAVAVASFSVGLFAQEISYAFYRREG